MIWGDSARVLRAVLRNSALQRALIGFTLFWTAECGVWVAILVYGYEVGGAAGAAVSALIGLIPSTLFALVASPLGDLMTRERALALGYAAQAATMGLAAGAIATGQPIWVVYLCIALVSCALTLTRPVYSAMLSSLAHAPEELTAANAVSSWAEGLGVFAGPMIAGLLLAISGAGLAFAAMALAQIAAAILASGVSAHPDAGGEGAAPASHHMSLVRDVAEGLRELRHEKGASALLLLVGCQFAIIGMLDVLSVELAFSVLSLDPSGPGILSAALGLGGLFGATVAMIRLAQKRLASPFVLGALANGVPLLLFGLPLAFDLMAAITLLAVAGGGKSFADVTGRTLLQRSVREDTLARVFGLQEGLSDAGMAVGTVLAPLLVVWCGARGALVGAGLFLPGAAVLAWRRLWVLDDRAIVPERELEILRRILFMEPLNPLMLERMASRVIPVTASYGDVVIQQGDPGDRFYVIEEGKIRVTVHGRHIAELGAGSYFGEIALLRNVRRTASVTALGPVKLLALERDEFLAAVTGSRRSAEAAEVEIARRLDQDAVAEGR